MAKILWNVDEKKYNEQECSYADPDRMGYRAGKSRAYFFLQEMEREFLFRSRKGLTELMLPEVCPNLEKSGRQDSP